MPLSLTPLPTPTLSQFAPDCKLGAQQIHIHCLDIRKFTTDHYAAAECIMNASERVRAQKFVRGKESYIASRWLLRRVLARYTGQAPDAIEFLRTEKGKPYLPQGDIYFSLSHSGDWALLAVGKIELIGVDIETVHATRDLYGIAKNYYHPHEFAQMQAMDGAVQNDYFYRLWTLKEAFFKAIGTGISVGLDKVAFNLEHPKIGVQIAAELGHNPDEWHFHHWALTARDYCALASKSNQPLTVRWFDTLLTPAFS